MIWLTIIFCSAISVVSLWFGRFYFNIKEESNNEHLLDENGDLIKHEINFDEKRIKKSQSQHISSGNTNSLSGGE